MSEAKTIGSNYYGVLRDDILRLIPGGTRTLLDVGCGEGMTGGTAKEMFALDQVVGIEVVEEAARKAEGKLDRVLAGDIETLEPDFEPGYFDCMLFADVLEHLRAPTNVLKKLRPYLKDSGVVVASIPNLRNAIPILKIITDRFEYEDSGILDRTHLHLFTLHTMKVMFRDAGFRITRIVPEPSRSWQFRLLNVVSLGLMKPFSVYRYFLVAVKDGPADSLDKRHGRQ